MLRRFWFNLMYLSRPPWDTGISPPELLDFIQTHAPGKALDVGCGTGTNLLTLAQAGWQVVGVDYAPLAVQQARRRLQAAGRPGLVLVENVNHLQVPGQPFQLILDIGCLHSLPKKDRYAVWLRYQQLLAPGATLLLYAHFAKPANSSPEVGLNDTEINTASHLLQLKQRVDSMDPNGKPAVWLWMVKGS